METTIGLDEHRAAGLYQHRIGKLDWPKIAAGLDAQGQVSVPGLLTPAECDALKSPGASLRAPLDALRPLLYERLVPIARRWSQAPYPDRLEDFLQTCQQAGQLRARSSLSCLREDDFLPLRQDAEGQHVFPLQLTLLLSEPERDFEGGELVLVEQRPRMQSRPMVVSLRQGDAAIFAVHHRPAQGSNGPYRLTLKHAVSRVRRGERYAIDLLFHDAGTFNASRPTAVGSR